MSTYGSLAALRAYILIREPMLMELSGLCDLIDAVKTQKTAYYPQGDGQVERLNKSLVKVLYISISDHRWDWADFVPKAVLAYYTSVLVNWIYPLLSNVWQGSYFAS